MHGQNDLPNGKEGMPDNDITLSDTWYTFEEVMAIFKRSKSTVNRWRRKKGFICCKIDGLVLFNKTDVDNFRKMHRN